MEVIIILVIIVVVGHFLYKSFPSTKFAKAQNLFNAKEYVQACNILKEIFDKHVHAPAKLAECKLEMGQQVSRNSEKIKYFNEVTALKKRINNSESLSSYNIIKAKALLEIAKIKYEESKGDIEKLNHNLLFIDTANKKGLESEFASLKLNHFYKLAATHFKKAIVIEKLGKYSESIQIYKTAKDYAEKSENKTVLNDSVTREAICQLKLNENISLNNVPEIHKSKKSYQNDLFYRYAIQLLKNNEFSEAEKIIESHLNFKSSFIDKLNEVIKAEKNNSAVIKITEINNSIEKLYNNDLTTVELKAFYESLDKTSNEVSIIDKELSENILAIKPTLFNRLLTKYISNEQYGNAITIISKYPKFWESPELLKNMGICCYGYTSKRLLTTRNYRIIIASWLTAVFSDKVILKSLEDTTWDDNYTFTLSEAIGSNYLQHEEIPENVNYDEASETNISIGATQRELLQQFEIIIHKKIEDAKFSKLINDFYDKEKEGIEKIIEVIDNDIFFATPYFATSKGLNNNIISDLDNNFLQYDNEGALEAGVPYIKNSISTIVYQYFFANDLIDRVISSINSVESAAIKKLNTKDNKQWIEKFNNISSSVEDRLFNAISTKLSEYGGNEKLIPVMEECIAFSGRNEKLKHLYSNFIANYCISNVNDKKIDNYKALSLMKEAYQRSPNNPKICKNIITLIQFNLMDILNDSTNKTKEIYDTLDCVKINMSQTYKQYSNELSKTRQDILQQMQQSGVDISLFDEDDPLSRLNQNYGQSLNAQGLRIKRVLTYLKYLGNEQVTVNPLDQSRRLRQQSNMNDDLPF